MTASITELPKKIISTAYCWLTVINKRTIDETRAAIVQQGFNTVHEICISIDGEVLLFTLEEFKEKLGFKNK